jgi:hypothetical protein
MLETIYTINGNKINNWLSELEEDRKKLFDIVRSTNDNDKTNENKIKSIENIQRTLITYKKLLNKEKEDIKKY